MMESVAELVNGDPDTGFNTALSRLGQFFHADNVSLTKIESVEGQYSIIAQWPDAGFSGETLNPWRHHSLLAGQTVLQKGSGQDGQRHILMSDDDAAAQDADFIRIPIYHSGKVTYCLGLDWVRHRTKLSDADQLQILEPAARLIQSVLQSQQVTDILRTLSRCDRLTGLVNRSVVLDYLEKSMARARRSKDLVAVVHLNIDRFKIINDALGYLNGDYLLKAVANRLVDIFREIDTIARIGNDDFVVVLEHLNSVENVTHSLQRIEAEFKAPMFIGGQNVHVQLSKGVAIYAREAGVRAEALLRDAEIAMKTAKDTGGNEARFFVPEMNTATKIRSGLEHDLHRALNHSEFQVHYQPQLCLQTGAVTGAEALIRWPHPELGMLPPSEFLWIAEETGLIIPLSEWILGEVCAATLHWHRNVHKDFQVAVNVSPRWFTFPGFPQSVEKILDHVDLPPGCLEFEITEDVILSNTETTGPLLAHLKDLGVKITLDDFGTGYSSLSYLRNIPVNTLKIDRSFVSNLETRKTDAAIVLALITLCNNLEIEIVAEGVETAEQLAFLKDNGCHLAQGYYIGRPECREALNERLEPRTKAAAS